MKPIDFEGANGQYGQTTAPGEQPIRVKALNDHKFGNSMVLCWEPSDEERKAITEGGNVWMVVIGTTLPQMILQTQRPFEPVASGFIPDEQPKANGAAAKPNVAKSPPRQVGKKKATRRKKK